MRRVILLLFLAQIFLINYGQIIADHTIVDRFDDIPQYYIDKVKGMWLTVPGESHSQAYRTGLTLLESSYPAYAVNVTESGTPEAYTATHLRASRGTWGSYSSSSGWIYFYGEGSWFTNSTGLSRTKAGITYCNTNNLEIAAIGFGWCWDATAGSPTTNADPVYGCRWYGWSGQGPDGDKAWGLDATDYSETGNSVSLDTYLSATQEYIDYCTSNKYNTKVFFTTGPVDTYTGETGYQGYLKYERIRDYVDANPTRILFDYADILCYDDNGNQTTTSWNGHIYPIITPTNLGNASIGHIGSAGSIRLAKAMWWMLARMAGWDGGTATIPVTGIAVTGTGGATTISTTGGTLQLSAAVLPANASNKTVTWTVTNGTGQATISTGGLVTAVADGTVTARATANDGSGIYGTLAITISNQVRVTSITVTGAGGATTISTTGGTLQLSAAVLPANASNKTVTWTVTNGTGQATISTGGLVTAVADGTVTARATANDGSGIYGTLAITISNQVRVTSITVTGAGGATTISTTGGTLQLSAAVLPANASNKTVTWTVTNGTGQATISTGGLVTAVADGTVTARATANDGSGIYGTLAITISNQVRVTSITVTGAGGATTISTTGGTLQLSAAVLPANASNKTVTWTVTNGTGQATISTGGLVTAVADGTVTARATANDGSGIYGTLAITISNQVRVTSITVTGAGGATTISTTGGTLQLSAAVLPANASNKTVTWTVTNGTGQATISTGGLVTAVADGTVTARATANDGSGVYGTLVITISNQTIPVTGITVSGAGGSTLITTNGGTLQLSAAVTPDNATNKVVTWSVTNGTGQATINSTGLVTAVSSGTVTAKATANDGSGISSTLVITISNQTIPVTGITVSGAGGSTLITTNGGTLQLSAAVTPDNATNKVVTWSVTNGTGQATINSTGLVTAVSSGTVTAKATANDGSGISGTLAITISNQTIPVTGITVSEAGGSTTITIDNGTLQLSATVTPNDATNKTVTWSISNGTEQASISTSGLVTAIDNGTVTAKATANDGSGISGTLVITISNQTIPVTGITVIGAGGSTLITTNGGTLQLSAAITPDNATNKTVTWSIANGTGQATINSAGLVTAVSSGTVTAKATANNGSGISGTLVITISSQVIPVKEITVSGAKGATSITTDGGSLQLSVVVSPNNASVQGITWSISNSTGQASINSSGLVTAIANGTVTAVATATDGSGVSGTLIITIANQITTVTSIIITAEKGITSITSENSSLQLHAIINPANATNQTITWSISSGSELAYISSDGLLTAILDGTVTIKATANDGSGVTGAIDIIIKISKNDPLVAIVDNNEIRFILNEIYLNCKISIYDLNGHLISSKLVDSYLCVFDISSVRSGLYIVVLSDTLILKVAKLIIP